MKLNSNFVIIKDVGKKIRIYVAGPLGFSEAGRAFHYGQLIPIIEQLGYTVLDPWKLTEERKIQNVGAMPFGPEKRDAWRQLNTEIAENNIRAIDQSNGIVAVLDGPDVDSGTAGEIGYGFARGKIIIGYRGDFRLSADNEGGIVNIQVEYFIRKSGGTIITEISKLPQELKRIFG